MEATGASSSTGTTKCGPVLVLINKRLRALRKKLNRISQMEEALSKGKALNKEQENTLRAKSSVVAGIDELEKLRQPLSEAVNQEIQIALEKNKQIHETHSGERAGGEGNVEPDADDVTGLDEAVSDLLSLVYFGSVFDVNTLLKAQDNMLTRTHERSCCLTYDYVTDDDAAGDPLKECDLDLIAMMGNLMISRPMNSRLSHKNALLKCVEHAKLWLANSDQPIEPNSTVTYAGLREKLKKIMASDYYSIMPEIRGPVELAAFGNYASFEDLFDATVVPQLGLDDSSVGSTPDYEQETNVESHLPTLVRWSSKPRFSHLGSSTFVDHGSEAGQNYAIDLVICSKARAIASSQLQKISNITITSLWFEIPS